MTLRGPGLSAERRVFVFAFSRLGTFLAELAESWRGWRGVKKWRSPEADLTIGAESDGGAHVRLRFRVGNGPVPTWTASIEIEIEAGEELAGLAREIEHLLPSNAA